MKHFVYQSINVLRYCRSTSLAFLSLLKDSSYYSNVSFYPEEKRKTSFQVFCDQVAYILRYGEVDDKYFINGMDRKDFPTKYNTLPHAVFKRVRDRLNVHPGLAEGYNYIMALKDKFYFNQFLTAIGFSTPTLRLLIDGGRMHVPGVAVWQPLTAIQDLTIDGCLKDIGGAQGKGVYSLKVEDGRIWLGSEEVDFAFFLDYCKRGKLIVQDRIIQHPKVSRLNESSVNTLRIVTVYHEGEVEVFGSFFRIGAVNSFTDNISRGGSLVEVDLKTGKLGKYGFILYPAMALKKHEVHPGTSIVYEDYEIPFYQEAINTAMEIHRFFYHVHSIGWDIAITEKGPCFIEGNDSWMIPFQGATIGLKADFERLFVRN